MALTPEEQYARVRELHDVASWDAIGADIGTDAAGAQAIYSGGSPGISATPELTSQVQGMWNNFSISSIQQKTGLSEQQIRDIGAGGGVSPAGSGIMPFSSADMSRIQSASQAQLAGGGGNVAQPSTDSSGRPSFDYLGNPWTGGAVARPASAVPGYGAGGVAPAGTYNPNPTGPYASTGGIPPADPPSRAVVSSEPARTQYNQNLTSLTNLEGGMRDYSPMKPGESMDAYKQRIGITAGAGGQTGMETGLPPAGQAITIQTANASMAAIVAQANSIVQQAQAMGIPLTPQSQALLNQINGIQDRQNSLTSQARTAADTGNATVVTASMNQYQQLEGQKQGAIDTLMSQLAPLRQQILDSMNPSMKEQQLNTQLADIKGQIRDKQLSLDMGLEKINGQPIPLQFLVGQSRELSAQGQLQLRGLLNEQSNLLDSLGLEQNARQMRTASLEQQMQWIYQDADLAQKAQDRLDQQEQQVVENARQLSNDSLNAFGKILDNFSGVGYSDLDSNQQQQLQQMANQYGIPINLLSEGLNNEKSKITLANALKIGGGSSGSSGGNTGGSITLSEAKSLGLPISVVGMSQADILASVQSATVPLWFKKYAQDTTQSSMTSQSLQSAWDAFRQKVLGGTKTTSPASSTGGLNYDSY